MYYVIYGRPLTNKYNDNFRDTKLVAKSTSSPELSIAFFREEIHCSRLLWLWVCSWYTCNQNVRLESQKVPSIEEN